MAPPVPMSVGIQAITIQPLLLSQTIKDALNHSLVFINIIGNKAYIRIAPRDPGWDQDPFGTGTVQT